MYYTFWGKSLSGVDEKNMKERNDFREKREHIRAPMHSTVIGILNSKDPETIGTIADISLGGAKCTYYEFKVGPSKKNSFHTIDLIAGNQYVLEVPCRYVWDGDMETKFQTKSTIVRQCGIEFGELAPIQTYMLSKFIDNCVSEGIKSLMPKTSIPSRAEQPSYNLLDTNLNIFWDTY